jgi:primosomal protein N' (replication factor Y)
MTEIYANVALPVPVPQLFTYIIPSVLNESAHRGSVAVVPFGSKILTGVIIDRTDVRPDVTLKSIIDILPPSLQLTDEQLRTAQWMAEYYLAPIGETVRQFLHIGLSQISNRFVTLHPNIESLPESSFPVTKEWSTIRRLLTHGPVSLKALQKSTSIRSIHSVVNGFVEKHLLVIEERLSTSPSAKKEWLARFTPPEQPPEITRDAHRKFFEYIQKHAREEIAVKSVLLDASVSLSTIKTFAKNGIIELFQREMSRKHSVGTDEQSERSLTIELNPDQTTAVRAITSDIDEGRQSTSLLYGITGSGKTQVYIECIRQCVLRKKSAIVLVPEISLTPQTVRRFQVHFGESVIWMHSKMSDGERYDAWRLAKSGHYSIVIGPRSALFAPLNDLGLIIVDEEHESSYKQFDASPRYHARDVAIVRGAHTGAVVLLGSATPSLESYTNAIDGKYRLLRLPLRADNALLPPVELVNMVEERKQRYAAMKVRAKEIGKKAFEDAAKSISTNLESKIRDRLEKKEGVILLQNRRGFAPFIECNGCGHVAQCPRCNVTMTYHATKKHLRCHYCGTISVPPTTCPECGGFEFSMRGFGTQRVEEELRSLFPTARILRMDLDTTSGKHSHEKILRSFGSGEADILLGTQMVAKGLDFPRVTLVGVISADTQMMLPDFRSAERTFQLLTQVAGRAGRSTLRGEVVIQTSQPDHYALKHVLDHDFVGFYDEEICFRRSVGYPPFSRIVAVEFKCRNEKSVETIAVRFGTKLAVLVDRTSILGPAPAVLSKINNEFRYHVIVKADKEKDKNGTRARNAVARVSTELHKEAQSLQVKMIVDIDPVGLL